MEESQGDRKRTEDGEWKRSEEELRKDCIRIETETVRVGQGMRQVKQLQSEILNAENEK